MKRNGKKFAALVLTLLLFISLAAFPAMAAEPTGPGIYGIQSLAMGAKLTPQLGNNTPVSAVAGTQIGGNTYDYYPGAVRFELEFTAKPGAMVFVRVQKDDTGAYAYMNQYTAGPDGRVLCAEKQAPYPQSLEGGSYSVFANNTKIASFRYFSPGVTVSGTAVSWNDTDNAKYLLYDAKLADKDIEADAWLDAPQKAAAVGTAGAVTRNADKKRWNQEFSFDTVPGGEYKLVIVKPGKYVPRIVPVTADSADLALGEQKLWLYGDVNYDGRVNASDSMQVLRKASGKRVAWNADLADRLKAAKVATANNGREDPTSQDAMQILRYASGKSSPVFQKMH